MQVRRGKKMLGVTVDDGKVEGGSMGGDQMPRGPGWHGSPFTSSRNESSQGHAPDPAKHDHIIDTSPATLLFHCPTHTVSTAAFTLLPPPAPRR